MERPGDVRLYTDLAGWWPLMSPPAHYTEEAADLLPLLAGDARSAPARTLVELGSGGGSLASHLKNQFALTLSDRSAEMLAVNRRVNPEAEHVQGDMTSLDLGREFDRVLIHDAIMYAITRDAVRATLRTASRHCRPSGIVIVVPDCVRETFTPSTDHGGEDGEDGRALRYLEWTWDPDPSDDTFDVVYAFALRDAAGRIEVVEDHHTEGCFARADWLAWFDEAGLTARIHHDPWGRDVFIGLKRA
jgi:trans-aconitate methyltransferase